MQLKNINAMRDTNIIDNIDILDISKAYGLFTTFSFLFLSPCSKSRDSTRIGSSLNYFSEWEDFLGVTDISISGIKLSGLSQTDGLL